MTVVVSDATDLKSLEAQFVQSQKMQAIGQLADGGQIFLRSKMMKYDEDVRKSGAVILAGKYVLIEV